MLQYMIDIPHMKRYKILVNLAKNARLIKIFNAITYETIENLTSNVAKFSLTFS